MPQCRHAFALHPLADADVDQKIDGPVLDQSGTDTVLDVVAAAVFDDDRFNAGEMQQPRQHQAGRPRADNSDLRAHELSPGDRISSPL